jgi:hypothetical protein
MRRTMIITALLLLVPAIAHSDPIPAGSLRPGSTNCAPAVGCQKGFGIGNSYLQFYGRMQNLVLWRNDSDFDRTAPYYNPHGQDTGVLGTFIAPTLQVTPVEALRIVWETEVGLNLWSLNDADEYDTGTERSFRLAIRQLFMEGRFWDGALGFRAGYEQLFDPSGMFLGHWIGAASLSTAHRWGRLTLTGAQIPDQTHEGIAYDANNFASDTFTYGLRGDFPLGDLNIVASVWGLHDRQVVGQPLDLMTATARLDGTWDRLSFAVDAALQYGVTGGRAAGADETTLAWAVQGSFDLRQPLLSGDRLDLLLHLNTMTLSGDDDYDGNDVNGAFFYSGKSRSKTMILTEDDLRDRGGNIDERLGERRHGDAGKFYVVRPGLTVTDLSIGLDVLGFFRPLATVAGAWVLNAENALGGSFVGFEADLHLEFYYREYLSFDLVGTYLLPGEAAAALVNTTGDREAVEPIVQIQGVATLWF